jgi:uncharacterized MAPEG superfamily protein
MTIAHWCVLAALLLPYFLSVLSRSAVRKADYVRDPRAFDQTLTGWHRRAHLAQLNGFESFPPFLAAVLIAQQVGAPQLRIDALAIAFVAARILHAAFYVSDRPSLRSVAWQLAMLCVIGLFVVAAL